MRAVQASDGALQMLGILQRDSRLIDFMAEDGIVGGYNGSNAREVLYTPEQWSAIRSGGEDGGA